MGRGNKKGGKKHKRGKKNGHETSTLRLKESGQEYAQITGCKGNCRFDVKCFDGKNRLAILCGTMRKRKFVTMGNIVLVSIRDFQDDKCDIIDVYNDSNVYTLKKDKHIPDFITIDEENVFQEDLGSIIFTTELSEEEYDESQIEEDEKGEDEKEEEDFNMDDI
tara:strand:- start:761 stop:1252 length:492 start_codon:yes stop_codon:yes gene_type:complete